LWVTRPVAIYVTFYTYISFLLHHSRNAAFAVGDSHTIDLLRL